MLLNARIPAFRTLVLVGGILSVFIITFLFYPAITSIKSSPWVGGCPSVEHNTSAGHVRLPPVKRRNVVVASEFGYHVDVYMAFVWTLERVINKPVPVYAEQPYHHGFSDFAKNINLHRGPFHDPSQLHSDLTNDNTIDMVVFGTCEIDLRDDVRAANLLAIWDARDDAHKFMLVCLVHNIDDIGWHHNLAPWTRRNAVRFITLSEHVKTNYRLYFDSVSDQEASRLDGYEYLPIDVFSPVLDIPDLHEPTPGRVLSNALLQGFMSSQRRNYEQLFEDLIVSLELDANIWGYVPLEGTSAYQVNTTLRQPPFKIHLLGSGDLQVPPALENIVVMKQDLNYAEFYAYMNSMDICLPSFARDQYFTSQASSTMFMALESDLPILVTRRMREAYNHIDDDRVVVTRPAAMSELSALRALRAEDPGVFFGNGTLPPESPIMDSRLLRGGVDEMLRMGWRRPNSWFWEVKRGLWAENDRLVERLLRDL